MMSSKPSRRISNRASLTRQPTQGPLDTEIKPQPLSAPTHSFARPSAPLVVPPSTPSSLSPLPRSPISQLPLSPSNYRHNPDKPDPQTKDLSFLLHPSFYLPIPQSDVPPQFHAQLQPIAPSAPISELLADLRRLLSQGEFLTAAHVAAGILTSPNLDSTDVRTVSELLATRYSCLELTGNIQIAAQESKALEDLNSEFYFVLPASTSQKIEAAEGTKIAIPKHILPFSLRMQASRLQSIGFSDPRRAVAALYDLGLECREYISSPVITLDERTTWERRLSELGIRVVNALIEIDDMECAKRTLMSLKSSNDPGWKICMGLLLMKVGDTSNAKKLLDSFLGNSSLLLALLATVEGRFEDAIRGWEDFATQNRETPLKTIAEQNLAVNYLYVGRLHDARCLLDSVVEGGEGYGSLTFNLATIYELSSEKSRDLKMNLASKVASQKGPVKGGWARVNGDFKL